MSVLLRWLDDPFVRRLGWMLLHSLWQGAVIGGLFELARFALRRRSANARYCAGCLALGFILLAAVVTLVVQSPPLSDRALRSPVSDSMASADIGTPVSDRSMEAPAQNFPSSSSQFFSALAPWLTPIWMVGVMFFSFQLTRSWCWVGRIRNQQSIPVDPAWVQMLDELRRRLGISRSVGLLQSALVEVPTVVGWLRPVILLPAASLIGLTPRQLEAILAHELAHVRRFDYVVNAFQCVVETLMFYHPIVWWISRSVREERENGCDDLVIQLGNDRVVYARALATLEELRGGMPSMALAAAGGSLVHRIRRLLGGSSESGPSAARQLSGLALLGIGVVLIAVGVFLNASKPMVESTVRIKLPPPADHAQTEEAGAKFSSVEEMNQVRTAMEMIRSDKVLQAVVNQLHLNEEWGGKSGSGRPLSMEETVELLRRRLHLRAVGDTSFLEGVISDNSVEAARLANAVAEAYRTWVQEKAAAVRARLFALEVEWRERETNATLVAAEVDRLREELNVSEAAEPMLSADTLRQLSSQLIAVRADEVKLETTLKQLRALSPELRREAIETAVGQDDQLSRLLQELNTAQKDRLVIMKDFGASDPTYRTSVAVISNLDVQVTARVDGIMLGFETKVEADRASMLELRKQIEVSKQRDLAAAERSRGYFQAKQKLSEQTQAKSVLESRIQRYLADLVLLKSSPMEIIDRATPPSAPHRPWVPALIGVGALFSVTGLVILKGKSGTRALSGQG